MCCSPSVTARRSADPDTRADSIGAVSTRACFEGEPPCLHRVPPPWPTPSSSRPGRRRLTRWPPPACRRNGPKAVVVVRDPGGRLRDLDWAPELDTEVAPVAHRLAGRARTCCGTPPRTCSPRPCRTSSRRRSSASARRSRTASTTTSTWPSRSSRTTWPSSRSGCRRSSRPGQTFRRRRYDVARRGQGRAGRRAVQARAGRHQGRRRCRRGDGGRRRRADHLRQPRRKTASGSGATCAAGRTCRPPG